MQVANPAIGADDAFQLHRSGDAGHDGWLRIARLHAVNGMGQANVAAGQAHGLAGRGLRRHGSFYRPNLGRRAGRQEPGKPVPSPLPTRSPPPGMLETAVGGSSRIAG